MANKIADMMADIGAVSFNFRKPFLFTAASKILSPMYCDFRRLISHPAKREKIVDEFVRAAKKLKFDVVGGVSTAGIPWAALIADRLGKPMIYIRPEPKGHGLICRKEIEKIFKWHSDPEGYYK